jgi:hypothetical protein
MKKLILSLILFCGTISFSQLDYVNDLKKNEYGLYEMSFKDPIKAIYKYNYVLDKNGSDTNEVVYDITKNPIDFGFFSNDPNSDNIIVSIFLRENNKYKIMFGEIDGNDDKYFFEVIDQNGVITDLYYRKSKNNEKN